MENGRERLALYAGLPRLSRANAHRRCLTAYRGGEERQPRCSPRGAELDVRRDALMLARETARLWAQLAFFDYDSNAHGRRRPTKDRP